MNQSSAAGGRPGPYDYLMLTVLGAIWGGSFMLIKVAVETVPPVTITAARMVIAAALLWLVAWDEETGGRAWKGFEWPTLDRLHEKGYIGDPKGKAKSVWVTPEGMKRSAELFERHFGTDA